MEQRSTDTTCWSVIRDAALGDANARVMFAAIYQPVIAAFLRQRWSASRGELAIDDAIQDVFIDCFRPSGALERADPQHGSGFRGFLYGIVRNVARRYEEKRTVDGLPDVEFIADETGAATAFDRAWAKALMKEAARNMSIQAAMADQRDASSHDSQQALVGRAAKRVELLALRFRQNLPIRDIARLWQVDPAWLHHEYATAREEFRVALLAVIAYHHPQATSAENEQTCRELLGILS